MFPTYWARTMTAMTTGRLDDTNAIHHLYQLRLIQSDNKIDHIFVLELALHRPQCCGSLYMRDLLTC
jgi:hypothetical protein